MSDLPEPEEQEEESADWLATFSDMVTLLLVFFVLLLSMSTVEEVKFLSVSGSLRDAFGGIDQQVITITGSTNSTMEHTSITVLDLERIRREILKSQENTFDAIRSYLVKKSIEGKVGAVLDEGTINLTIGDGILFEEGKDTLSPEAEEVLIPLLDIIKANRDMTVSIKGYTDSEEVTGENYKDYWELSALRAVNILRWLIDNGINPLRLNATGMGDLNPRFPNDTPENRAKNRRVEFNLERTIHGPKS